MNKEFDRWCYEWQRMRSVDWQTLDIREAGEWPVMLRGLCGLLVCLMALGTTHWWLVGVKREQLALEQREEIRLLHDYRSKALEAASLPTIRNKVEVLNRQIVQMRAKLTSPAEIASLLASINDAAVENRLIIESIRPRPAIDNTHYIEYPLNIEVCGGYHELTDFLADISQLGRMVTLHDFTLEPAGNLGDTLRLTLLARIYGDVNATLSQG